MKKYLVEGLEAGDLKRLIKPVISIDEFKSKLGRDEDVCVLAFTVKHGKEPALDLVNFAEKGYSWVIDADTSAGENDDGNFLVFIELERNKSIPGQVLELVNDLCQLVEFDVENWTFTYHQNKKEYSLTADNLSHIVPLSEDDYKKAYSREAIDSLKAAAGVTVDTKAPVNSHTESIRIAAGLK